METIPKINCEMVQVKNSKNNNYICIISSIKVYFYHHELTEIEVDKLTTPCQYFLGR